MPVRRGDIVEILPEFQDPGDDEYVWIALDDEEKGRVTIQPQDPAMRIAPNYVVKVEWLKNSPTRDT